MSPLTERPLLVLHDVGDERGGAPWREAFVAAGWGGPVLAPDLPGHAGAPLPEGGDHEPGDGAFQAVVALAAAGVEPGTAVVVGVGLNGWNAQLHGLGGRAAAVVVVDGLGGPWTSTREQVRGGVERLRAVAADPEAVAPMRPGAALDPRLRYPLPAHGSRKMALEAAGAMPVPVVVVESSASPVPAADAEEIVGRFPRDATLVRIDDPAPAAVAAATVAALASMPPA